MHFEIKSLSDFPTSEALWAALPLPLATLEHAHSEQGVSRTAPELQEESAEPVDACLVGMQAPVRSGPAAWWRKRKRGGTPGSSTTSKEILPGANGNEQGHGLQGDVRGPSTSSQAEWALLPSSKHSLFGNDLSLLMS